MSRAARLGAMLAVFASGLSIVDLSAAPPVGAAACDIVGTDGDDTLTGTNADEVICGFGGDDVIDGGGGDDILIGAGGSDRLLGGDGDDLLIGGAGVDVLTGGAGSDRHIGEADGDIVVVNGSEADDSVTIAAGVISQATGTRDSFAGVAELRIDLGAGDDALTVEPLVGVVVRAAGGPQRSLDRLNVTEPPGSELTQSNGVISAIGRGDVLFEGFELVRARDRWLIGSSADESITLGSLRPPGLTVDLLGGSDTISVALAAIEAPLVIDDTGTTGRDVVSVTGTGAADDLVIEGGVLRSPGRRIELRGVEELRFDGGAGDDTIAVVPVPGRSYRIRGGPGADRVVVSTTGSAVLDAVRSRVVSNGETLVEFDGVEDVRVESDVDGIRSLSSTSAWLLAADGVVIPLGDAPDLGDAAGGGDGVVGIASTRSGDGYWVAHADGTVETFGDAVHHGDMSAVPLQSGIVAMERTASGNGYFLLGGDGGVFSFGDAAFAGSMGGTPLVAPVVDLVVHPEGKGYWLIASDGGVFAFTPDGFFGSLPGLGVTVADLNAPIIGGTATPTAQGYWMFARDGGVFGFGDARFLGSVPGLFPPEVVPAPTVAAAGAPFGDGYWLLGRDGGVFAFGGATFVGSGVGQADEFVDIAAVGG